MDRKPADGISSEVAVADLPAARPDARPAARLDHETPYRRPPVQLPEPDTAPAEGTTGSSWFGGLVNAGRSNEDSRVHEDWITHESVVRPSASRAVEEPAAKRAETPEPKYGPAPPATAGRTSFGFTAGPISPVRPASGPVSPAWTEFAPAQPAAPADHHEALPAPAASPSWSGTEPVAPSWPPPPRSAPVSLALEPVRHAELPIRSVPMAGSGIDTDIGIGIGPGSTGEFGAVRREPAGRPASPRTAPAANPRQPRFVTVGMLMLSVIVLAAGTVIGVVYFSGDDQSLSNVLNLGNNSSSNATAKRTVTAPLDNRSTASFEMLAAASTVHVSIGELGDDLYRISTPDDAGIRPSPVIHNDNVQLQVTRDGDGTGGEIEVVLAAKVNWQLRFSGYADEQVIDVSGGQVSGIEMIAGMHRAELDLGKPSGTVPVKITGAVDQLVLRSPDGCPMRVSVGGAAKTVVAGSRTLHKVAAGSTLTPKDWAAQKQNRYDVTTASAITSLSVENLVQ